ncbi:MAG: YebC/PmpR family DNA-binding transcriptional regulator, partial [Candidatus Portnoybacteria bacterium CG_4_9_14_3_um_filter_43_11]
MSGHSHWHNIKFKKELTDKKRGKTLSKISRLITVAAKEKGADPETNPKLKLAI